MRCTQLILNCLLIYLDDFGGFIFVVFIFDREFYLNMCLFIVCLGG